MERGGGTKNEMVKVGQEGGRRRRQEKKEAARREGSKGQEGSEG